MADDNIPARSYDKAETRRRAEAVKERIDMRVILAEATGYRKQISNGPISVKCPFHDDRTPSMSVKPRTYKCFCPACGKEGDVFTFYQDYYGMGFGEALEELEKGYGCAPVVKYLKPETQSKRKVTSPIDMGFIWNARQNYHLVADYMRKRGVSDEVASWNLVGGTVYERFYKSASGERILMRCNRVLIPHLFGGLAWAVNYRRDDESCHAWLASIGKTVDWFRQDIIKRDNPPAHYIKSSMSDKHILDSLFGLRYWKPVDTQQTVFGLDQLGYYRDRKVIYDRPVDNLILCEGEIDAMVLQTHGYWGVAYKESQALNLLRITQGVTVKTLVWGDNDPWVLAPGANVSSPPAGFMYAQKVLARLREGRAAGTHKYVDNVRYPSDKMGIRYTQQGKDIADFALNNVLHPILRHNFVEPYSAGVPISQWYGSPSDLYQTGEIQF